MSTEKKNLPKSPEGHPREAVEESASHQYFELELGLYVHLKLLRTIKHSALKIDIQTSQMEKGVPWAPSKHCVFQCFSMIHYEKQSLHNDLCMSLQMMSAAVHQIKQRRHLYRINEVH